ncbi:G2/mitotic-specific cyclin cdc13 [Astathelohania contejeani]|uniref:G2/mitotic-specific cyclin cdc13 n=1 Tax=Astathelohania contejeani TaxID=164912 RepID=A0ABQ7I2E7_9MICR|nr:G2/mitotic-specific cyclin cdc13 [Thelohania contejeani]
MAIIRDLNLQKKKSIILRNITNKQPIKKTYKHEQDINQVLSHLTCNENLLLERQEETCIKDITMYQEYIEHIFKHFKDIENKTNIDPNYMSFQDELTWSMRELLVDWMVDAHCKLELATETLFLSINIIDRFLSLRTVSVAKLQLVGITSLMIASKYEEVVCPTIDTFASLSETEIYEEEIIKAEKYMLHVLDYRLEYSSPLNFLRKNIKFKKNGILIQSIGKYLLEMSMHFQEYLLYPGSMLAASAMSIAYDMIQGSESKNSFFVFSYYKPEEIKSCVDWMINLLNKKTKYENLIKKYSSTDEIGAIKYIEMYEK